MPEVDARNPEIDVRDLRVLVTAGAGGIGRTIAESFAAAGAKVHVTDVVEPTLAATIDAVPGLTGTIGDASRVEDVDRVFDDVSARFGGLDLLVNNAGIAGPTGRVDRIDRRRRRQDDRRQSQIAILFSRALRAASDELQAQSVDHRHEFGRGAVRLRISYALRRDQMGDRRPDQVAGDRAWASGRSRQRDPSRRRSGPADGPRHRRARGGHGPHLRGNAQRVSFARSPCGGWSRPRTSPTWLCFSPPIWRATSADKSSASTETPRLPDRAVMEQRL